MLRLRRPTARRTRIQPKNLCGEAATSKPTEEDKKAAQEAKAASIKKAQEDQAKAEAALKKAQEDQAKAVEAAALKKAQDW